jgi:uncharacterized protein YggE
MTLVLIAAILAFPLFAPPSALPQLRAPTPGAQVPGAQGPNAESQSVQNHIITVSRSGEAYAKPDLGILIMSIRSSSPIADEAVAENGRKATAAQSALAGLGFAPTGYQVTSVTFG